MAAFGLHLERRAFTAHLILVAERDPVLRRGLRGRAPDVHGAPLELPTGNVVVWQPMPSRRIEGVGVRNQTFQGRRCVQLAIAAEEPQAIALDWSAIGDARVIGAPPPRRFGA